MLRALGSGMPVLSRRALPPLRIHRLFVSAGALRGQLDRLWCNPDCGLKTRGWAEVLPALRNMVEASRQLREELQAPKN